VPINGFSGVSRERLRALDGSALATLAKTDELELIYRHLASLGNFNDVKDRFLAVAAAAPASVPVAEPAAT
jgi:hypothetical protein